MIPPPALGRICLVTHSGYPFETRSRRMAEALVECGYAVDVLCLRLPGQPAEEVLNGVHLFRLPVTRHQGAGATVYLREYISFFLLASRQLLRMHRRHPYLLVQAHDPPDALVFCTLPLKLGGTPVILDMREIAPELFMSRFRLSRRSAVVRLLTLLERWACAYAGAVIVTDEARQQVLIDRGVRARQMIQVLNCPDDRFNDSAGVPAAPDGQFVVFYHGGMLERYGVDLLVEAVGRLRGAIPGLRLELYGAGDFLPRVQAQVDASGLNDVVRFHGQRPLEELPAAIAAASVGVVPMRQDVFTDLVLPTKLMEYVAMGLPSLASRTYTTMRYFDDTMVGFFAPGAVEELAGLLLADYRNPEAARARAARATSFTALHNWRGQTQRYLKLVECLTGDRSHDSHPSHS